MPCLVVEILEVYDRMSRIGRLPIPIPEGVRVDIEDSHVTVTGPRGQESMSFHPDMRIVLEDGRLVVTRPSDQRLHRSLHGLTRALLRNMVQGVTEGFRKELLINGTGYRAEMQGKTLVLFLGYTHPVRIEPPAGLTITVARGAKGITVEGTNKQMVGEVGARIRAVRKPNPYLGTGVFYAGEKISRKAGKTGRVGII